MPFKKGQVSNPTGRKKGSKNKISTDIKQYILDVDAQLRKNRKGLMARAKLDPDWFYSVIWSKIVPKTLEGKIDLDLTEPMRAECLRLLREHLKNK